MHTAHAILGHALLTVIMLSALGALSLAIFRLDRKTQAHTSSLRSTKT